MHYTLVQIIPYKNKLLLLLHVDTKQIDKCKFLCTTIDLPMNYSNLYSTGKRHNETINGQHEQFSTFPCSNEITPIHDVLLYSIIIDDVEVPNNITYILRSHFSVNIYFGRLSNKKGEGKC